MTETLDQPSTKSFDVVRGAAKPAVSSGLAPRRGRVAARVVNAVTVLMWALVVVAAYFLSAAVPVKYTAQSQAIAGGTSVTAAAVPSFAEAGQSLAQTYSRVFDGDGVQVRMRRAGALTSGVTVTASPIPDSSVVLIEAEAPTQAAALKAANDGVIALTQQVSSLLSNTAALTAAKQQVAEAYHTLAEAQQKQKSLTASTGSTTGQKVDAVAAVGAAQSEVSAAESYLQSEVSQSGEANGLAVLSSGESKGSNATTITVAAVGAGFVLGLLLVLLVNRRFWLSVVFRPRGAPGVASQPEI